MWRYILLAAGIFILSSTSIPLAGEASGPLSLKESIGIALRNNFTILSAEEAIEGAEHERKAALADFFPKLRIQAQYSWLSEVPTMERSAIIFPANSIAPGIPATPIVLDPGGKIPLGKDETWGVQGSVVQPIFTGGALINQYRLAVIGKKSAKVALERIKQDLSMEVVKAYFDVLNTIELKKVADQAVRLLENQRDVAQEFYKVGMIPKNDLLKTEVQLAEMIREQIKAKNAIELAKSRFNLLLQRDIDTPVELENILSYKPLTMELEEGIRTALKRRIELREMELKIKASERQVRLAQSEFFPKIQLSYTYFKHEGGSFATLEEGWTVEAQASWTFWEWGKKYQKVSSAKSRLIRDRYAWRQLRDRIILEVKDAFLALKVAERNIFVAKKAIEQGEENLRMNQERYREQVGTITDVLDAQTLLTKAQTDYYNALRSYNVAKAALRRAMGIKVYE